MEWEIKSQKNGNSMEIGCKGWDENGYILDVCIGCNYNGMVDGWM